MKFASVARRRLARRAAGASRRRSAEGRAQDAALVRSDHRRLFPHRGRRDDLRRRHDRRRCRCSPAGTRTRCAPASCSRKVKPTAQSFIDGDAQALRRAGRRHPEGLPRPPPIAEALESAASLASDMFIGYGTWKWIETHRAPASSPVYRYSFDRKIPVPADETVNGDAGDLARHRRPACRRDRIRVRQPRSHCKGVPWEPIDRTLSDAMTSYWAAFAQDRRAEGREDCPSGRATTSGKGTCCTSTRRSRQARRAASALRGARHLHGQTSVSSPAASAIGVGREPPEPVAGTSWSARQTFGNAGLTPSRR